MSTATETRLDSTPDTRVQPGHGAPQVAHIVKRDPSRSNSTAAAQVTEARVYGTPLEALCGHVWVPSKNPKTLPLCEECRLIFELHGDLGDHEGADPNKLPS